MLKPWCSYIKNNLLLLSVFLFTLAGGMLLYCDMVSADNGSITGSVVNVRSGPGTNYTIDGNLYQGTEVSVLDSKDGWYKISAGKLTGWVSGDYLKVHSLEKVRVTKELVNLRSGPSTAHAVIGQAVKGDVLTLVGTEGDWYKVQKSGGQTCYIASYLVEKIGSLSANTGPSNQQEPPSNGSNGYPAPTVYLNGNKLSFEVDPIIENDRTLVPLRAIFEAMGATVSWNQDTRTVTAVRGITTVVLPIGSTTALVNGNKQTIDVPAKIVQDRTLAPLRFVGEAFGGQVNWDAADRTIRITTDTNETDPPSMSQVMVSEEVVNLRSGPSISYDKVASARKGEILHVLAHKDGWYQVSRGGITSWVADWVVDVAWEPDEPSIVEPEEPEIPAEEPTLPEPPLTEKPAVLAANEVWVSCEKDAQGLRVVVESGSRVDGSLTETENSIKYNFLWRKVLNQIELQEQVGSEKLSLNIANQSDCAIVEISLPKTMDDYQIINENNGLRQVIFFPNRITRISREVAGNDGDNIIIYTLTPGSYTSELKDNILEVKLESTAMGVERSEYEYKISPVLKKMTISESAGPVTTLEIMTQKLGDYNIFQTQEDNAINICLTAQKIKQPDRKNIVVIDPGHGGSETGAIRSGIQEKNINLAIALKVGQILKSQGMEVEYTRSGDSYMGRPERAEVANKLNAALFVSIHCNSHTTSQAHGTETYYYAPIDDAKLFMQKEQRSKLANYVQRELSRALGTADRGVKQAAYTVLVQTDMPSILTEVAFMSNPQELSLLTSKSFQDKAANAIASGILKYLGK